jgi:hypothetical protein
MAHSRQATRSIDREGGAAQNEMMGVENGGAKLDHGGGGEVLLRAA